MLMAAKSTKSGKTPTKKPSAARKAPAKKVVAKKAAAKKVPVAKKAAAKKAPAKKVVAKKAAAKKAPVAKKAPAEKAPVEKVVARKAPAKKAAAKKAVAKKSPFGAKFLDQQKRALLEERARYVRSADTLQAEADSLLEDRDPGDVQFDDESGEGDTLAVERDLDLALSAQARDAVDQIDAALERIRKGVYGVCVASGRNVPKDRLVAIPWASERVEFKVGGLGRR
jgi:RNA polymerase-binding transcription factor DksA